MEDFMDVYDRFLIEIVDDDFDTHFFFLDPWVGISGYFEEYVQTSENVKCNHDTKTSTTDKTMDKPDRHQWLSIQNILNSLKLTIIPVVTAMPRPQYVFGTMSPKPTLRNVIAISHMAFNRLACSSSWNLYVLCFVFLLFSYENNRIVLGEIYKTEVVHYGHMVMIFWTYVWSIFIHTISIIYFSDIFIYRFESIEKGPCEENKHCRYKLFISVLYLTS